MSKRKKPILFEDIEWGNKTLPGLSEEELMNTNWNLKNTKAEKERLRKIQQQWHKDNPTARKELAQTKHWQEAHSKGVRAHLESAEYVNPRGMLGKKASTQTKQKQSKALSGKAKPIEGNKKLSKYHKGKSKNPIVIAKVAKAIKGKTYNRGRRVHTPLGEFDKVKLAGIAHNVTECAIRNRINNPNYSEYYYLEDSKRLVAKRVQTDKGIFANCKKASEEYNISPQAMRARIKSNNWPAFCYIT